MTITMKNIAIIQFIIPLIFLLLAGVSWIGTEVRYAQQGDRHDWMKPRPEVCDPCMSVAPPKTRKGMIAVEQADGSIKTKIVEMSEEEYQKLKAFSQE